MWSLALQIAKDHQVVNHTLSQNPGRTGNIFFLWRRMFISSWHLQCLSMCTRIFGSRHGTTHSKRDPPTSVINRAPQSCSPVNLEGAFSQLKPLLPNDSHSCQVDIKLTSTWRDLKHLQNTNCQLHFPTECWIVDTNCQLPCPTECWRVGKA